MNRAFIELSMLFCHVLADFNLQGILSSMKQKRWWEKSSYHSSMYRYDYIVGLFMHSVSWSFIVMLPIAMYMKFNVDIKFIVAFIINTIIHSVVDDMKANRNMINLASDQAIHIIQIVITALALMP